MKKGRIITGPGGDDPEPPNDNGPEMPELPPLPAVKLFVLDWFDARVNTIQRKDVHAHVCNFTESGGVNFVVFKKLPMDEAMDSMRHGGPPYKGRYVGCFPNYVFIEEIEIPEGKVS